MGIGDWGLGIGDWGLGIADQRHLAAFESDPDAAAGTGPLALLAAACGLTVAGAVAAALPVSLGIGAGHGREFMQFHVPYLLMLPR